MKTMWKFKTRNFTVIWDIEREPFDPCYMDAALIAECRKNIRTGAWKCFASTISVVENSTGAELGAAHLGNSIYANPAEFRDHIGMNARGHGSYFSQMVREAIAEARATFPAMRARAETVACIKIKGARP